MSQADWIFNLALLSAILLLLMPVVFVIGREVERDAQNRRDLEAAEQMRASIREYDDRVAEFVPTVTHQAQSEPLYHLAGMRTTASASLSPRRRD